MWGNIAQEMRVMTWISSTGSAVAHSGCFRFLSLQPPVDQSLMALTEKNKKMISLKRGIALKDQLIARLCERLDARGILQEEDLNVAETF